MDPRPSDPIRGQNPCWGVPIHLRKCLEDPKTSSHRMTRSTLHFGQLKDFQQRNAKTSGMTFVVAADGDIDIGNGRVDGMKQYLTKP